MISGAKTMIKKMLASTLTVAMISCVLPVLFENTNVVADTVKNQNNTCLGTSKIAPPVAPNSATRLWQGSYAYYGSYAGNPIKFRVLAPSTTTYGGTTMFLDSDVSLFFASCDSLYDLYREAFGWEESRLRGYLNDSFYNKYFSSPEQNAIATSVFAGGIEYPEDSFEFHLCGGHNSIGVNDKIFLLDLAEVLNPEYGYTSETGFNQIDKYHWERNISIIDNRQKRSLDKDLDDIWLLRTYTTNKIPYIDKKGVFARGTDNIEYGIAPALNINHSSIIFSSLISGEFNKVRAEYKLTVEDPNISIAVQSGKNVTAAGTQDGKTVSVPYQISGADSENANRASVLITNIAGTEILYYDSLNGVFGKSTTGTFTLPSDLDIDDWGKDYEVFILAEQINGEKSTDYACSPVKINAPEYRSYSVSSVVKTYDCDGNTLLSQSDIGGTVSLNKSKVLSGEEVIVTAMPQSGYTLKKIEWFNEADGTLIDITSSKAFTSGNGTSKVYVYFQESQIKVRTVNINNEYLTPDDVGGVAYLDKSNPSCGDKVNITAIPNSGYILKSIIWWDKETSATEITETKSFTAGNSIPKVQVTFQRETVTSLAVMLYSKNGKQVTTDVALTTSGNAEGKSGTVSLDKVIDSSGEKVKVTALPNNGYSLNKIEVKNEKTAEITDITTEKTFTVDNSDYSVFVYFHQDAYMSAVIYTYNADGVIVSSEVFNSKDDRVDFFAGTVDVDKTFAVPGETVNVTATPKSGYFLKSIKMYVNVNDEPTDITTTKKFTVADFYDFCYLEVSFQEEPTKYNITLDKGENGKAGLSKTTAVSGDTVTVTAEPNEGYEVSSITFKPEGGTETSILDTKTFTMPDANVLVFVRFKKITVNGISVASAGKTTYKVGETLDVSGMKIKVDYSNGTNKTIPVTTDMVSGFDSSEPAANQSLTITYMGKTTTCNVNIVNSHKVTVKTDSNGSASATPSVAAEGETVNVSVKPNACFDLDSITVDGVSLNGNTFKMPDHDVEVKVTFKAKPHTLERKQREEATCSEEGHEEYYECSSCHKKFSDADGNNAIEKPVAIPKLEHEWDDGEVTKKPTCEGSGVKTYHCKRDGCNGEKEETIDPLGHDKEHLVHHPAEEPTYDKDGHIDYYSCPREGCGQKFTDPEGNEKATDADIIKPKTGAAVRGEIAPFGDFEYQVTNAATNGTGTVTLIGVINKIAAVSVPPTVKIKGTIYKVDRIGAKAFYGNKIIKTLSIGANVVTIDAGAFYGCSNLTKVSGGKGLKTIGASAFARCSKLKSFSIASPVLSKIGNYAFNKDSKLKTISIKYTTKLTKGGVKKSLKGSKVKTVKVKKSKVKKYKKYFKKKNSGRSVKVKK